MFKKVLAISLAAVMIFSMEEGFRIETRGKKKGEKNGK